MIPKLRRRELLNVAIRSTPGRARVKTQIHFFKWEFTIVHYHYLPKTNMSSQLGTVAGLLLKAKWEKFLARREISELSHSLGRRQSLDGFGQT
jgi:hypothetical protein